MGYFINILTLYNTQPSTHAQVESVLTMHNCAFERIDNTYFTGAPFKTTNKKVVDALRAQQVIFTYFHVAIKTGSELLEGGIDAGKLAAIRAIYFSR